MIGEGAGRGDRRAVDAMLAAGGRLAFLAIEAGAELMLGAVAFDQNRDGETARAALACAFGEFGAPQAATGREQRQRLDQIGLAGAVFAAQSHQPARQGQIERGVGAEVLQDDPSQQRRRTRRAGRCFVPRFDDGHDEAMPCPAARRKLESAVVAPAGLARPICRRQQEQETMASEVKRISTC